MSKHEEFKKIYNKPEKTEFIKNFSNMEALVEADALRLDGYKVTPEILSKYRDFIKKVIEVYGEDWDINVNLRGDKFDICEVDVLFEDITLTNSENNTHHIKDLYVRLKVVMNGSTDNLYITNIFGARGSVSLKEYSCGYQHSHLHSTTYGTAPSGPMFDDFCTGSGEINDYRARYNSTTNSETREEALESLLMQLFTLVSWESLEGVPYVYMSNLRYRTTSGTSSELVPIDVDSTALKGYFVTTVSSLTRAGKIPVKDIDVEVIISGGCNKIVIDFKEEYWLKLMGMSDLSEFIYVEYRGGYHKEDRVVDFLKRSTVGNPHGVEVHETVKNTGYIFRGKEISLEIYDYKPTEQEIEQVELIKTIPNAFKQYLQQHFEKELNEQQAKRIIAERYA